MDKSIEEYNLYLLKKYESTLNIIEYFSKIHHTFFPEVDVSFMNYFLDLSTPARIHAFCIYEKDLRKYGLLSERVRSRDLVVKHNLIKQVDWVYQEAHEDEIHYSFFNLSGTKKGMIFTPKAFKKMILQSSNIVFMEYYMLMETIFRYYHDYQIRFAEKDKKRRKQEMEEVETKIEKYEEYIQSVIRNANETMEACRHELNQIIDISIQALSQKSNDSQASLESLESNDSQES